MFRVKIEQQLRDQEIDFDSHEYRKLHYNRQIRRLNPTTIRLAAALEANDNIKNFTVCKSNGADLVCFGTNLGARLQDVAVTISYWKKIAERYYDLYRGDIPEEHKRLIEVHSFIENPTEVDKQLPDRWFALYTDDIQDIIDLLDE